MFDLTFEEAGAVLKNGDVTRKGVDYSVDSICLLRKRDALVV